MLEWNVKLAVSGPIAIKSQIIINVRKGSENPFWTTVKIKSAKHGVKVELIARANNNQEANDVGVFFIGQMLDLLSIKLNIPLYVSLKNEKFKSHLSSHVKRIVTRKEIEDAFQISREYSEKQRIYLIALGWYRKALSSEDPIDKLLALWSSLEGVCSPSAYKNERTKKGIINKICDCFDQLWGSSDQWKVIQNKPEIINNFKKCRDGIAHGFIPVTIETIKRINDSIPVIEELTFNFLTDWEIKINNETNQDVIGLNLLFEFIPFCSLTEYLEKFPYELKTSFIDVGHMFDLFSKSNPHLYPFSDEELQEKFNKYIGAQIAIEDLINPLAQYPIYDGDMNTIKLVIDRSPEKEKTIANADELKINFIDSYNDLFKYIEANMKDVEMCSYIE